MKNPILTFCLIALSATVSFSQSESFLLLKEKFRGCENVFSFGTSGFLAKTVLWAAGERDYREVFRDVRHARMIVIPKKAFRDKHVTLNGFKKVAGKEGFEEVLTVRDGGDNISLLTQSNEKNKDNNCYLLIVDDHSEVFAVEMIGYIDPQAIRESCRTSSNYKNL